MCLILFSYKDSPKFSLKLLANRDEFYNRPTQSAHWWPDQNIFCGKDLKAGGTWLGISKNGRFAALTNYRDPINFDPTAEYSRGNLITDYLKSNHHPQNFTDNILPYISGYNDFNLLMIFEKQLYFFSSQEKELKKLSAGTYGLSNATLDSRWPKIVNGKQSLDSLIQLGWDREKAFSILQNKDIAPDDELPETGVGIENERLLSPICIESPIYGTRSSAVLEINEKGYVVLEERDFINKQTNTASFEIVP